MTAHTSTASPPPVRPAGRRQRLAPALAWACAALTVLSSACTARAAAPLPRLGVDLSQASVSGLSSGAYMAVQMHVAHSATFAKGAGVVAGGPYYCAEGAFFNATGRCMRRDASIPLDRLAARAEGWARSGDIDPLHHLAASKVFIFAGTADRTVDPSIADELLAWYRRFMPAARITVRRDVAAGHAMITDDAGGACAASEAPFIVDCDLDLAGEILAHLHGPLKPRSDGPPRGSLVEFDQTAFVRGHGMAATGWAYVPQACAAGAAGGARRCGVHVAFHGCRQNAGQVGQQYVRQAGYNRWADSNALVVLYPQTGGSAPNGCWDWWGYDSDRYATKAGPQVAAVKAMVDALASTGTAPARATPASPSFAPSCHTASNYDHTVAGRARASMGMALANGSNQNLGLWNVLVVTTLKETAPGHWVVGRCQ